MKGSLLSPSGAAGSPVLDVASPFSSLLPTVKCYSTPAGTSYAITPMRHIASLAVVVAAAALATVGGAAASPSANWYPAGYVLSPLYPNVAGRWDHAPRCAYGASCEGLYLVTKYGCPNGLYVEINTISHGAVVGFTNDLVGSVRPRQVARLTFNVYNLPAGAKPELTKIHCY